MTSRADKWSDYNYPLSMQALLFVCAIAAFVFLGIDPAFADPLPQSAFAESCTYNQQFNILLPPTGGGVISLLVNSISNILSGVSQQLYDVILNNDSFKLITRAALTIFVIIYGIVFTFGLTQITMMDFLIRIAKFGIVATLITPGSWTFFNTYVVQFFHGGTNWLIAVMANIALPNIAGVNANYPFAVLDNAITTMTSSRMFVTLTATFFTGPYGIIIAILIIMGLGSFASALFQAMWVYLMSLVVRAFLFALAPIFFSFLLFSRTRHLFDGWINALVSSMLQPVFLFAFFAFFSKLVEAAMYNLLRVPVCWTPVGTTMQGTPFSMWGWRFMVPVKVNGVHRWEMWAGDWSFLGAGCEIEPGVSCPVFPLSIMDVLIFLIIVQLAWRFNGIVIKIAQEIAGASLALNMSGAITDWMNSGKGRTDQMQKMANEASEQMKNKKPLTKEEIAKQKARLGDKDYQAQQTAAAKAELAEQKRQAAAGVGQRNNLTAGGDVTSLLQHQITNNDAH